MPSGQVFINYRRDDSEGYVGRIYDRLAQRFPDRIFRDVTGLRPGDNFVDALEREGRNCQVLLAVVGRHWLTVTGALGGRRLDDPNDILRQEIVRALERNVLVIPILVGGAQPPKAEELPDDIRLLANLQALPITEFDFEADIDRLIRRLEQALDDSCSGSQPTRRFSQSDLNELMSRAHSAIARQDWSSAIPALQSVLVLNPADAEAASQLQFAVRQKELAGLFARGQAFYEKKDYTAALGCFQQVRTKGGNYNDVDSLIAEIHLGSTSALPPKPTRLRWIVAGGLAVLALLFVVVIALVNQEQSATPAPIVYGSTSSTPLTTPAGTTSVSKTGSNVSKTGSNSPETYAWLRDITSAMAAIKSWRDHITGLLASAPATVEQAQSMAQQLLAALDSYDQQLNNLTVLLTRGEQQNLLTTPQDRLQAQAIGQVCDIRKEQSAKLRYEAQLLLQYNPMFVAPQVLQSELMPIDAQIRDLDMRAAQIMTAAGLQ
jgi:tetratricopeptide (TPR) repeat protein